MSQTPIEEQTYRPLPGWPFVALLPGTLIAGITQFIFSLGPLGTTPLAILLLALAILLFVVGFFGFQAIAPNACRVVLLFGVYRGTTRRSGFYWVNPFFSKRKLSLRIRNFETGSISTPTQVVTATGQTIKQKSRTAGKPSKVNDRDGNPIEISAVVVWKVVNTTEALFEVDDYEDFVAVQSESALRNLASRHPYDSKDTEISLRGNADDVCEQLAHDIQARLDKAGVEVLEARISHLAYAPEIAASMLQRQQAQAVVAARTRIVDGAVGMVRMAIDRLSEDNILDLDEERKAAMVSNLLVVLCGDRPPQPVINTGSLYQ